jgi:hypothetical protein
MYVIGGSIMANNGFIKSGCFSSMVFAFVFIYCVFIPSAKANPAYYHATIDVSGISSNLELEFDLFDNAGTIGDTFVLIDNVQLANGGVIELVDFEGGTLSGFDVSLNPGSVGVVSGNLDSTGSYLLRMDEDLFWTPTITWRDFMNPGATSLSFDFLFESTGEVGPFGPDELVVSLLDPLTLYPAASSLNDDLGDVLRYNAIDGISYSSEVTAVIIPTPDALLLGLIGTGVVSIWRRLKQANIG